MRGDDGIVIGTSDNQSTVKAKTQKQVGSLTSPFTVFVSREPNLEIAEA